MKKKHVTIIAIMGLLAWSFNACEGPEGPAGTVGTDGTDGTDGIDATGLPPAGTFFSLAVNNNAGDMQFGSFVNYLAFDSEDADVTTNYPDAPQVVSYETPLPPEIDGSEAEGEWIGSGTVITLERITDFEKYDGQDPVGVTSV
ncbi:MAG: hypothetical protein IID16_07265 [Candidatus Marinimicrobia bacterium]|nr:hypothetical protein [Candidatus Neomarinimicrobiota bacterium]